MQRASRRLPGSVGSKNRGKMRCVKPVSCEHPALKGRSQARRRVMKAGLCQQPSRSLHSGHQGLGKEDADVLWVGAEVCTHSPAMHGESHGIPTPRRAPRSIAREKHGDEGAEATLLSLEQGRGSALLHHQRCEESFLDDLACCPVNNGKQGCLDAAFWCELCAQNTICFANGFLPFWCWGTFQKSLPCARLLIFFSLFSGNLSGGIF